MSKILFVSEYRSWDIAQGDRAAEHLEATIKLERVRDGIAQRYEVEVLCGYFRSAFASEENVSTLERVCAEHTTAHGRELCC